MLRYVPDPGRGEFANVGFIVGSDDTNQWELCLFDNLNRAKYLDRGIGIWSNAHAILNDLGARLQAYTDSVNDLLPVGYAINEAWLMEMYERKRHVLQLSYPAPLVADKLETAKEIIREEFAVDRETRSPATTSRTEIIGTLRQAYRRIGLVDQDKVLEYARIVTGRRQESGLFDFVVANGRAVQLAQTWSFRIMDDDLIHRVKSWAWTVNEIREYGGETYRGDVMVSVPQDITINVLYVPPTAKQQQAFEEACYSWEELNVKFYEDVAAEAVAIQARQLLTKPDEGV